MQYERCAAPDLHRGFAFQFEQQERWREVYTSHTQHTLLAGLPVAHWERLTRLLAEKADAYHAADAGYACAKDDPTVQEMRHIIDCLACADYEEQTTGASTSIATSLRGFATMGLPLVLPEIKAWLRMPVLRSIPQ